HRSLSTTWCPSHLTTIDIVADCIGTTLGLLAGRHTSSDPHDFVNACTYQPGTGLANAPRPTSSSWPTHLPLSRPFITRSTGNTRPTAALEPSLPQSRLCQPTPAHQSPT